MQLVDIPLIGWLDTIACVAALMLGGWSLVAGEGTGTPMERGAS